MGRGRDIREVGEDTMRVMAWIGAAITIVGAIVPIGFVMAQAYVPAWPILVVDYGLALVMTAGIFANWRRWRLSRSASASASLKEAGAFTMRDSILVAVIALVPAAALWGFFTLLSTLPG